MIYPFGVCADSDAPLCLEGQAAPFELDCIRDFKRTIIRKGSPLLLRCRIRAWYCVRDRKDKAFAA
jgi:hypothetical protein